MSQEARSAARIKHEELYDAVHALCDQLGLDANMVGRINIFPRRLEIMRYRLDENGAKYVDLEVNAPAVDWLDFKVRR